MRNLALRMVDARWFKLVLVVAIAGTAIAQGLSISFNVGVQFDLWLGTLWLLTILLLLLEVLARFIGLAPQVYRYFGDCWNIFDLLVVAFVVIGTLVYSPLAPYGPVVVLVRLLRLLRGLSTVREMRTVLSTLFRSLPSLMHIVILMCIIIYAYALVGIQLFSEHDPERWGSLGLAATTLFQVVTMDGWGDIMYALADVEPAAWAYFISFVVISGFVVANIFIALIIATLDDDRKQRTQHSATPPTNEEILSELRSTQETLRRLEKRMKPPKAEPPSDL